MVSILKSFMTGALNQRVSDQNAQKAAQMEADLARQKSADQQKLELAKIVATYGVKAELKRAEGQKLTDMLTNNPNPSPADFAGVGRSDPMKDYKNLSQGNKYRQEAGGMASDQQRLDATRAKEQGLPAPSPIGDRGMLPVGDMSTPAPQAIAPTDQYSQDMDAQQIALSGQALDAQTPEQAAQVQTQLESSYNQQEQGSPQAPNKFDTKSQIDDITRQVDEKTAIMASYLGNQAKGSQAEAARLKTEIANLDEKRLQLGYQNPAMITDRRKRDEADIQALQKDTKAQNIAVDTARSVRMALKDVGYTGLGGEGTALLDKVATTIGLPDYIEGSVSAREAFTADSTTSMLTAMRDTKLPGSTSDYETKLYGGTTTDLLNSNEGNNILSASVLLKALRGKQYTLFKSEWLNNHPNLDGSDVAWSRFVNDNGPFTTAQAVSSSPNIKSLSDQWNEKLKQAEDDIDNSIFSDSGYRDYISYLPGDEQIISNGDQNPGKRVPPPAIADLRSNPNNEGMSGFALHYGKDALSKALGAK